MRVNPDLAGNHGGSDGPGGRQSGGLGPDDAVALGAKIGAGLGRVIAGEGAELQLQIDWDGHARGALEIHRGAAQNTDRLPHQLL